MACLRASLTPAARTVYKYSLGLSEADVRKPRSIVSASVGVSGERQKFLRLLQQENESIASWETKIRNQAAQCEYQDFADELMRDQFIAGLTSDALQVKLIGKWHRHKTTQEKVKLREVVEVAKTFEATTFANQPETHSRSGLTTQPNRPSLHGVFGVVGNINNPVSNIALQCGNGKKMCKMRHHWPFRARLQGWSTTTSSTAAIQFCL